MFGHGQDARTSSCWKPGQSGNPKGRRVGSRNKKRRLELPPWERPIRTVADAQFLIAWGDKYGTEDEMRLCAKAITRAVLAPGADSRLVIWYCDLVDPPEEVEDDD